MMALTDTQVAHVTIAFVRFAAAGDGAKAVAALAEALVVAIGETAESPAGQVLLLDAVIGPLQRLRDIVVARITQQPVVPL